MEAGGEGKVEKKERLSFQIVIVQSQLLSAVDKNRTI